MSKFKNDTKNKSERWLLVDTETTGLSQPIHAVEIAAQNMDGWEAVGEPFRYLIDVEAEIPSKVSRIHGYTKEILQRDGHPPTKVYQKLKKYADGAPVCSYNLKYDYDEVLLPEWGRLGLGEFLLPGFCLLKLTQRLIDPVAAGNHKLQTLRQFYRLPERGAHTALGDVETVIDLLDTVLRPLGSLVGLYSISDLKKFTEKTWFPTRIPFGKYRGRSFQDARQDGAIRSWIEWLAESDNERSRSMGLWYIEQLAQSEEKTEESQKFIINAIDSSRPSIKRGETRKGIVVFNDEKIKALKALVAAARERLADLEMILDRERAGVAKTQADLFLLLKEVYRLRDTLKLLINYRQKFIQSLLAEIELEPDDLKSQFADDKKKLDEDFDEAESLTENMSNLDDATQNEMKDLYRKLVKLYHPDRVNSDDAKSAAYTKLMSLIIDAKNRRDIDLMREIANDPAAFMTKHNLGKLQAYEENEVGSLKKLYESLQIKIFETISDTDELRSGEQFAIYRLASRRAGYLEEVASQYKAKIEVECQDLRALADKLSKEMEELQGEEAH
jgi:DNA polymerase III epsilon subunit-like protein